jgi:hypothetical protein
MKRMEILSRLRKLLSKDNIKENFDFIFEMVMLLDPLEEPLDDEMVVIYTESCNVVITNGFCIEEEKRIIKDFNDWVEMKIGSPIQEITYKKIDELYEFYKENGHINGYYFVMKAKFNSICEDGNDYSYYEFYEDEETKRLNKEISVFYENYL